jgi:uncharacterized Zn finger protein
MAHQTFGETIICPSCNYHYDIDYVEYLDEGDEPIVEPCPSCGRLLSIDVIVEVRFHTVTLSNEDELQA